MAGSDDFSKLMASMPDQPKPDAGLSQTATIQSTQPDPSTPTDYSSLMANMPDKPKPSLSSTYKQVMDQDASKSAKIQKLATDTGMKPGQIAQNTDSVDKATNASSPSYVDDLPNSAPITAKFASDPKNMVSIHDDLPAHVQHESVFADYAKGVNSTIADVLGKYVLGGPFEQGGIGPFGWGPEQVKDLKESFQSSADFIASSDLDSDALNEYVYHNNTKPLVAQIANGIPSMAVASLGFIAGRGYAAVQAGVETAGQNYEQTGNPLTSTLKGVGAGTVAFFTAGYFQKLYAPLVDKIGSTGAKEVINQAIQHFAKTNAVMIGGGEVNRLSNAIIDKVSGDNPKALEQYVQDAPKEIATNVGQALLMTLPGLGFTVVMKGPGAFKEDIKAGGTSKTPDQIIQGHIQRGFEQLANQDKELFLKGIESNNGRKLAVDNPHQNKAINDELTKQYGGQTVHIPVEQFQQLYQDDAPKMAESMGKEFKESFDKASGPDGTGGTVSGPFSELLNSKADIKPNELADHVKFDDPTKKTVFEAQESKKELEANQVTAEQAHEKALADFQKQIQGQIEKVGGEASKGSATQAKGIAKVLDNLSKTIKVPVDRLMQLYKFKIQKEVPQVNESFNSLAKQAEEVGMLSPSDYVKSRDIRIYINEKEQERLGLTDPKIQKKYEKGEIKDKSIYSSYIQEGYKVTFDATKGSEPNQIANSIKEMADKGIPRSSMPEEWFEGTKGADANADTLFAVLDGSGSGVETIQKLNQSMQEHYQSGIDPYGLSKEDQKDIFGNVIKPKESPVDKVFGKMQVGDMLAKPNLDAKQQSMFSPKETETKPQQELFQSHRGRTVISGLAGEPQGRSFETFVAEGADKSTLFHEFAHNFLQIFRDHVVQDDATPEAKDMEAKLLKWFDVKDWSEVTDRHSEMFARGFEYRLWEGKSPSYLEKIFQKFSDWIRKIYPSSGVMAQYLKNVGATMTDEMRGVYDRFIASSEEIERAEKEMGYKKEAPEGLSEKELNDWKSKQDEATQKAMMRLNKAKMKMLGHDASEQYLREKETAEKKAKEQVDNLQIFKAQKDLEKSFPPSEGKTKELGEKYLKGEADEIETEALAYFGARNGYTKPADFAYGLANSDYQKEINDRVAEHLEDFKERVHSTPAEIRMAILGGEERTDAIAHEGALMKVIAKEEPKKPEPEPEPLGPKIAQIQGTVAEMKGNALKSEMEKAQGKKAVTSIKGKKPELTPEEAKARQQAALKQYRIDKAEAKTKAYRFMDDAKLKDAKDADTFMNNMKNAVKKTKEFKDKGNTDKANEWHDKQLLNQELALQSVKNGDYIKRSIRDMRSMAKIEKKPLTMPFGHWFQIKDILETAKLKDPKPIQDMMFKKIAMDMANDGKPPEQIADTTGMVLDEDNKPRRETLQEFKERIGNMPKIEDRDESFAARINVPAAMDLKQMTMRDLRNLKNSLDAIYAHGRDIDNLVVDGKNVSCQAKADEFAKQIASTVGTPHVRDILHNEDRSKLPAKQRIADLFLTLGDNFIPDINHIETVAELIDGAHIDENGKVVGGKEGVAHDILTNPLRDAKSAERTMFREVVNEQKDLFNKYYPKDEDKDALNKEVTVETSGGNEQFTRAEAKNITAMSASREGLDRLQNGNKWTDADLEKIKAILKKEDVDYLRERARLDEKHWPKVVALEAKRGIEVKPCEKIDVQTPYGTLPGMYHPIAYDYGKGLSLAVAQMTGDTKDLMEKAKFVPLGYPDKGFTKTRATTVARPVRIDDGVYKQYLSDTTHYLTHQEAVMDVNKALRNKTIQVALNDAFGAKGASLFATQTKYIAYGTPGPKGPLDQAFQWTRIASILYHIGIRPKLFVVKRMTDVINLSDEIGGFKNYLQMQDEKGMTIFSPKFRALMDEVNAKSSQMRDRGENFDYNVRSVHEAFSNEKNLQNYYIHNAYLPEKLADRRPAYLSWKYIETKALAEGKSQHEASRMADMFVEQILGGGSELQHIGIMRGEKYGEFGRSFSPAFTFFSAQYQRLWLKGKLAAINYKASNPLVAMKVIAGAGMRFVVTPALITGGMIELIKHHKEEPVGDRVKRFGEEGLAQLAGLFPSGRNIAQSYLYHRPGESVALFPIEGVIKDVWDGFGSLFKGIAKPSRFTEKDADNMINAATELLKGPQFLENEILNLYDDVMKNGPKDWVNYLSATRYPQRKESAPYLNN